MKHGLPNMAARPVERLMAELGLDQMAGRIVRRCAGGKTGT